LSRLKLSVKIPPLATNRGLWEGEGYYPQGE
jgi:hypothetical protein